MGTIRSRVARAREQLIAEMRLEPPQPDAAGCSPELPVTDRLDDARRAGRTAAWRCSRRRPGRARPRSSAGAAGRAVAGDDRIVMLGAAAAGDPGRGPAHGRAAAEAVGEVVGYRTRDDRAVSPPPGSRWSPRAS